ncbi:MAG: OapC/ArvC family zinc-ribbon domain-containing protein [Candidatus Kariarchaeaceae archaeon]
MDESVCRNCDYIIDDLVKALLDGCPVCHHRRFKFIKKSMKDFNPFSVPPEKLFMNSDEMTVGIKILDKGIFELDLKTLAENDDSIDPVIIQDKKGVFNIIIEPESE